MEETKKTIEGFYEKFLGRQPDNIGLESFLKRHSEGLTLESIQQEIQQSKEAEVVKMKKYDKCHTNFTSTVSQEKIQKIFDENGPWYHWIRINEFETSKTRTSRKYQMWIIQNLPDEFTNKSVLDIGCADGYYSFLAESRNAKKVLAIDAEEFDIGKVNPFSKNQNPNKFQILKSILNSKVEYQKLDIYDIDKLGQKFDFVFMYGVYYHLQDLVLALRKVSSIVNDSVFLSGHILDSKEPLMYYYDIELEPTIKQKFAANVASPSCLTNIAKFLCNFKKAELIDSITMDYGEIYPHNHGSTEGKIGLFKFSK